MASIETAIRIGKLLYGKGDTVEVAYYELDNKCERKCVHGVVGKITSKYMYVRISPWAKVEENRWKADSVKIINKGILEIKTIELPSEFKELPK